MIRFAEAGAAERVKVLDGVTVSDVAVAALPAVLVMVRGPVAAPEGIRTPSDEAVKLCSGRAIEPPPSAGMLTWGDAPKLPPLMVTRVPTAPDCGVKVVMVGVESPIATVKPLGMVASS